MNIIKEILPYVVSISASIFTYIQTKKKLKQELEIVKTNNNHEIDKLMKQHKIDIENLKETHRLEMELKDKEYEHEKEIIQLKSKTIIDEKGQETMNTAMSSVMGNLVNDIISGKISTDKINELSQQFKNKQN